MKAEEAIKSAQKKETEKQEEPAAYPEYTFNTNSQYSDLNRHIQMVNNVYNYCKVYIFGY